MLVIKLEIDELAHSVYELAYFIEVQNRLLEDFSW